MSALLSIKPRGDRYIWLIAGLLMLASTLLVYSATGSLAHRQRNSDTEYYLFRHIGISGLGLILMYVIHHIKIKEEKIFYCCLLHLNHNTWTRCIDVQYVPLSE